MGGGTEIIIICAAVYLVGAYIMAFACGYFDSLTGDAAVFWPVYLAGYMLIGALAPFIWTAMWLFNAGRALRGRK